MLILRERNMNSVMEVIRPRCNFRTVTKDKIRMRCASFFKVLSRSIHNSGPFLVNTSVQ